MGYVQKGPSVVVNASLWNIFRIQKTNKLCDFNMSIESLNSYNISFSMVILLEPLILADYQGLICILDLIIFILTELFTKSPIFSVDIFLYWFSAV